MRNPFLKSLMPVWENPHRVYVAERQIKNVAKKLSWEKFEAPGWFESVFPANPEEFMKFIVLANAINFCFTEPYTKEKFLINYKGKLWRGSMAMAACLKRALDEGKPLFDANYLENLTLNGTKEIFRYNHEFGETPIPLLNERVACLVELGEGLKKYFKADFLEIYKASDFKAFNNGQGLVESLIKHFPSFNDASIHVLSGERLEFQKRVQLLAMVYQGRALASKDWPFPLLKDADNLGPPADYAVPVALEDMGILVYCESLKSKIEAREIILKNSLEEQEIRAQTVYAMVKLMKEINKLLKPKNQKINILHLDYKIWQMGRNIKNKPHHLTSTVAY